MKKYKKLQKCKKKKKNVHTHTHTHARPPNLTHPAARGCVCVHFFDFCCTFLYFLYFFIHCIVFVIYFILSLFIILYGGQPFVLLAKDEPTELEHGEKRSQQQFHLNINR